MDQPSSVSKTQAANCSRGLDFTALVLPPFTSRKVTTLVRELVPLTFCTKRSRSVNCLVHGVIKPGLWNSSSSPKKGQQGLVSAASDDSVTRRALKHNMENRNCAKRETFFLTRLLDLQRELNRKIPQTFLGYSMDNDNVVKYESSVK